MNELNHSRTCFRFSLFLHIWCSHIYLFNEVLKQMMWWPSFFKCRWWEGAVICWESQSQWMANTGLVTAGHVSSACFLLVKRFVQSIWIHSFTSYISAQWELVLGLSRETESILWIWKCLLWKICSHSLKDCKSPFFQDFKKDTQKTANGVV